MTTKKRSHKKKPPAEQAAAPALEAVAADDTGAAVPDGVISPVPLDEAVAEVATQHPVKCETCGRRLINVVSGALCPNGCGGLHPFVSSDDNAAAVRDCRMSTLPQAHQLMHVMAEPSKAWVNSVLYRVRGIDNAGLWRRVKKESQSLKHPKLPEATLMAYDVTGDAVIWLAKDKHANIEIISSFPEVFELSDEDDALLPEVTKEEVAQADRDAKQVTDAVLDGAAKAMVEQTEKALADC